MKRTQLLSKLPDRKRVNLKLLLTRMLAINVLSRNLMVARLVKLRPGNFTFNALLTFGHSIPATNIVSWLSI